MTGAFIAAAFVCLPIRNVGGAVPYYWTWLSKAAAFSYSLYLTHVMVIWVCRLIGYKSGLYSFHVNDWRKFAVFLGTMVAVHIAAYTFSLVTERHTNRVRRWILRGSRTPIYYFSGTSDKHK